MDDDLRGDFFVEVLRCLLNSAGNSQYWQYGVDTRNA